MKREAVFGHTNAIGTRGAPMLPLLLGVLLFFSLGGHAQSNSGSGSPTSTGSGGSTTNKASVSDLTAGEMEVTALGNILTNHLQEINRRAAAVESSVTRHEGVLVTSTA